MAVLLSHSLRGSNQTPKENPTIEPPHAPDLLASALKQPWSYCRSNPGEDPHDPAHLTLCVTLEPMYGMSFTCAGAMLRSPCLVHFLICAACNHTPPRATAQAGARLTDASALNLHTPRECLVLATAAPQNKTACHDPPGGLFAGCPVTGLHLSSFEAH